MAAVKCICQICTCGRHRCPQHPQSTVMVADTTQPCALSEYSTEFKMHACEPRREGFRPNPTPNIMNQNGPEVRTTTAKEDYVAHVITPRSPRTPVKYQKPEGTMEKESEYKLVYVPRKSVPAKPIRHVSATRTTTSSKFEHKSSHMADYIRHQPQKTESYAEKRSYQPPTEPFKGTSTIQSDFVDHGHILPPAPLRPQQNAVTVNQKFDGNSSYKESFVPMKLPDKFVIPKQERKPPDGAFVGETTFKHDFKSYGGTKPAQSMKPAAKVQSSAEPFEGTTVNKDSYKVWDMPAKFTRPPSVYVPPAEKFNGQTTVQADFRPYEAVPVKSIRPPERTKDTNVPFDGSTTQKVDYREWKGAERAKSLKETKTYQPPTEKFEGLSTVAAHYKGQYAPPAPSTKPPPNPVASTQPFDSNTSYHDAYIPYSVQPIAKHKKEEFSPPEGQFYGETTVKHDYKSYDGTKPAQSMKPAAKVQSSAEPFEGITVNKDSYKVWDMPAKFIRPPSVYVPPAEKFNGQTTVQADFRPYEAVPVKSIRPPERTKDTNVPFDSSTTQKVDYREWKGAERAKSLKETKTYQPPTEKFEGLSTVAAHYKGQYAPPAQAKKPAHSSQICNSKMDSTTLYKDCFKGGFVPCPAQSLSRENTSQGTRFKYEFEDPGTGHLFFSPVSNEQVQQQAMEVSS